LTLFTLLIVIALERIIPKSKALHISTLAQQYFSFINQFLDKQHVNEYTKALSTTITMLLVTALPSLAIWMLVEYLPVFLVFFLYLLLLWICLGCPQTRHTYKCYLQAANRKDYEACFLHSAQFGNECDDLADVGTQLVFINYRHYASIIIFLVILGLPGIVFYSLCKEWCLFKKSGVLANDATLSANETELNITDDVKDETMSESMIDLVNETEKVMFVVDWLPVRITAFGFLLVGHFSRGLPVWLNTLADANLSAYEVLAKVAKASEDFSTSENPQLDEPLQMVKLVKRNIIFLLMAVSVMTLVGVVS
jgi:AmpE protein